MPVFLCVSVCLLMSLFACVLHSPASKKALGFLNM